MTRLGRKLAEIRSWTTSVRGPLDWPAAVILAIFRTRPAAGDGVWARAGRALVPRIWVRPRLLGGLWLRMLPSLMSEFVVYEEVFINGAYDLSRVSFEPDAVVDCGAFEGYFSLLARAHFGDTRIVAFEPHPGNFERLVVNARRNRMAIDARRAAVSTRDGTTVFTGEGCGGRLADGAEKNGTPVTVTDLRRVIHELSPKKLLLKIDVEGEEAALLPALLPVLPDCCAMFFEWHHGERSYADIVAMLAANGFATAQTRLHRDDDAVYIDAFAQRF